MIIRLWVRLGINKRQRLTYHKIDTTYYINGIPISCDQLNLDRKLYYSLNDS